MWKEEISATLWFICMKAESPMQLGSLTRITDLQCLLQLQASRPMFCIVLLKCSTHGTMALWLKKDQPRTSKNGHSPIAPVASWILMDLWAWNQPSPNPKSYQNATKMSPSLYITLLGKSLSKSQQVSIMFGHLPWLLLASPFLWPDPVAAFDDELDDSQMHVGMRPDELRQLHREFDQNKDGKAGVVGQNHVIRNNLDLYGFIYGTSLYRNHLTTSYSSNIF